MACFSTMQMPCYIHPMLQPSCWLRNALGNHKTRRHKGRQQKSRWWDSTKSFILERWVTLLWKWREQGVSAGEEDLRLSYFCFVALVTDTAYATLRMRGCCDRSFHWKGPSSPKYHLTDKNTVVWALVTTLPTASL